MNRLPFRCGRTCEYERSVFIHPIPYLDELGAALGHQDGRGLAAHIVDFYLSQLVEPVLALADGYKTAAELNDLDPQLTIDLIILNNFHYSSSKCNSDLGCVASHEALLRKLRFRKLMQALDEVTELAVLTPNYELLLSLQFDSGLKDYDGNNRIFDHGFPGDNFNLETLLLLVYEHIID